MKQKTFLQFRNYRKRLFFVLVLFTFHFSLFTAESAAQPTPPPNAEPPPLKLITPEEKKQLDAVTMIKERTTLALALMDARLKAAEDMNSKSSYQEMFVELGGFHALIDNTLNFLMRNDDGRKLVLNNYKRLEIALRAFISRLEIIRRELAPKYEFYVRGLMKDVRDARTKAVEPHFDDNTVRMKDG